MGAKQKRRLARAQAEHARLNAAITSWQTKTDLHFQRGQDLVRLQAERDRLQEQLENANSECSRMRDRMVELALRVENPPPIIVDMKSFTKAVATLPYTRPDTGQARSDMPRAFTLAVGVAPWIKDKTGAVEVHRQEQQMLEFSRESIRVPSINPRENMLAYRVPSGVVLVDRTMLDS